MSDHDPYGEPTRVDVPVTDPTTAMPATTGGPPLPPGPPPPVEPPDGRPDRRGWILAGLLALVLLVGLAALLLDDDDEDDDASPTTTTSTTAPTSTSESTTTTEATTTTTASTTTTAASRTCAPATSPSNPDGTVTAMYQAYADGDRACAEELGTDGAIDALFDIPGNGGGWTYQGCTQVGSEEPEMDCAYSFDGGATHFAAVFSETDGWLVTDVFQTTD